MEKCDQSLVGHVQWRGTETCAKVAGARRLAPLIELELQIYVFQAGGTRGIKKATSRAE
jgi:hypothetical protein